MKKLFALVLSLALVVAFAVPALASGWAQLDWQIPVYKDITMTLTGLELSENTSKIGSLYAPLSTYYPVVNRSRVHFYAEVVLPAADDLSPAMQRLLNTWKLDLNVAVTSITLDDTFKQYKNNSDAGKFDVANYGKATSGITVHFGNGDYAAASKTVWGYEFWGTVNTDGKDAVVEASIGFYNKFNANVMEIDNDMDGIVNYRVEKKDGYFIVDVCTSAGATNYRYVKFPVSGDKVDKSKSILISASQAGGEYSITKSTVKNPDFLKGNDYATGEYNALKAVYDAVFGFLKFDYEEANYMTEAHFEHFFGEIVAHSETITYPNGSVIVNPVNPSLPQTGDNASIIGFAMVVVAMVAAAVVTFKKVRA